tara:strand:- start:201 stop:587 length:387 start_codon:yes stop_codon:yes gene_type:complete
VLHLPNISHRPTDKSRAEVEALASFGTPQEDIAAFLGVSKPTLAKHYKDTLKIASIKASGDVGSFLYHLASGRALKDGATHGECSRAAMFWAKTRMGWRETDRHEFIGDGGGALKLEVTRRIIDSAKD